MIEPAAGAERTCSRFMFDAYDEEEVEGRERVPCCASTPGWRPSRRPCCRW